MYPPLIFVRSALFVSCLLLHSWSFAQTMWQESLPQNIGDKPVATALGDLNADGHLDLVVAGKNQGLPGSIGILWGSPYGFQGSETCHQTIDQPLKVYAQDLNGDGRKDILVTSIYNTTIYFNGGPQTAGCPIGLLSPVSLGQGSRLAGFSDLNGDGKIDIHTTFVHELYQYVQSPSAPLPGPGGIPIPQYSAAIHIPAQPGAAGFGFEEGLAVGDFDGDGTADAVVAAASPAGGGVFAYFNRPGAWVHQVVSGAQAVGISMGDFNGVNGDGLADFAVTFASQRLATYFNGGFDAATQQYHPLIPNFSTVSPGGGNGVGIYARPLVSGDFNTDGKMDLAYQDVLAGSLAVLYNQGSGIFDSSDEMHFPLAALGAKDWPSETSIAIRTLILSPAHSATSIQSLFNRKRR